jgi:hypothetical protein
MLSENLPGDTKDTRITYYWIIYKSTKSTSSKIAGTKVSGFQRF